MDNIFLFSMNISGLYIRYAWNLHKSWRFKFLYVCVSGNLVELQLCDCMQVCVCMSVRDALKALLAVAVEMLHCPTLLSGDSDGEVNG